MLYVAQEVQQFGSRDVRYRLVPDFQRNVVFQRIDPVRRELRGLPRLDEPLVIRPRHASERSLFLLLLGIALALGFARCGSYLGTLVDRIERWFVRKHGARLR